MGAHEKKETCASCNGKKGWYTTKDGEQIWIPCAVCNGTREVP